MGHFPSRRHVKLMLAPFKFFRACETNILSFDRGRAQTPCFHLYRSYPCTVQLAPFNGDALGERGSSSTAGDRVASKLLAATDLPFRPEVTIETGLFARHVATTTQDEHLVTLRTSWSRFGDERAGRTDVDATHCAMDIFTLVSRNVWCTQDDTCPVSNVVHLQGDGVGNTQDSHNTVNGLNTA